jgi:hypothetical protein
MFKSRDQRDRENYDIAMKAASLGIPAMTEKWQRFCEALPFKPDVPLLDRINAFSHPTSKWAYDNIPDIKKTQNPLPWFFLLFAAVHCSGTHSDAEVDKAMTAFSDETKLPPLHDLVNVLPKIAH